MSGEALELYYNDGCHFCVPSLLRSFSFWIIFSLPHGSSNFFLLCVFSSISSFVLPFNPSSYCYCVVAQTNFLPRKKAIICWKRNYSSILECVSIISTIFKLILTSVPMCGFFLYARQFSYTRWVSHSLTQFWDHLPGDCVWSHRLSAQSHKTALHFRWYSQTPVVICASN